VVEEAVEGAADHPDVYCLIVLGVSRQGPRGDRLSLTVIVDGPTTRHVVNTKPDHYVQEG
jgi:hypothetical protein